jgi:hypothetical protein
MPSGWRVALAVTFPVFTVGFALFAILAYVATWPPALAFVPGNPVIAGLVAAGLAWVGVAVAVAGLVGRDVRRRAGEEPGTSEALEQRLELLQARVAAFCPLGDAAIARGAFGAAAASDPQSVPEPGDGPATRAAACGEARALLDAILANYARSDRGPRPPTASPTDRDDEAPARERAQIRLAPLSATESVNLLRSIHAIEIALIRVEPEETVVAEAIFDQSRLDGSNIGNRAELLARSRRAVKYLRDPRPPSGPGSAP